MMINFQSSSSGRKTELHTNEKDKHMQGSRNVLDCFVSTMKLVYHKLGKEKTNRSLYKVAIYSFKKNKTKHLIPLRTGLIQSNANIQDQNKHFKNIHINQLPDGDSQPRILGHS